MKGRNKIIRKETIRSIFIMDCIFILLFIIAFGPWSWNNDINKSNQIIAMMIVLVSIIIGNILLWSFLYKAYSMKVKFQESALTVQKQLSKDKEVEVIPIRDDIPSIKKLKECSKFYATYDGKNMVSISIKVNNKEKHFFESLNKNYFTFYYKIK